MRFSLFSTTDHYPSKARSLRELYAQLLDEIELGDQLGFDAYFVAEHHFHEYGAVPSPAVLLAAAARRTERIGLGVAIVPLPFHDPIRVAEDYGMVDMLSDGRLRFGIGSGYLPHEFSGFGKGPWEKRHRFEEAIEVIETAWKGDRFSHHGLYYHYDDVQLNVTPRQRKVPVWVAILRAEAAYYIGRQGRNLMLLPYASVEDASGIADLAREYRRGLGETRSAAGGGDFTLTLQTFVTAGEGLAAARQAMELYLSTRLYARQRALDELDAKGLVLFGTPEQVSERIVELGELGMTHLMACCDFGGLDRRLVQRSVELLANEVVPLAQASLRGGRRPAAAEPPGAQLAGGEIHG
jgi:alkanesulfonate monooxygenase SsuD/methylene tetrahydromethanopterin reductase-like flavin-dependent oxidoreductase (luciferase family)